MNVFFIEVTDLINKKSMLIRGDLIFNISEYERNVNNEQVRMITFVDGQVEYVLDTMNDLIRELRKFGVIH